MANTKNYTFFTDEVGYEETETKGGKDYFVTGYISTKDRDLVNDVVSENALSEMLNQINHKNIKLDVEHEAWREENPSIVPVGKIIEAKRDEKGIFVKAILNRAHGRFKEVWDSVKSGFLDAFSIAFKTTSYVHKVVDGVKTRILNGVELLNVALTGNPVNPECKMTEVFTKSLNDMEEIKMAEEVVEKKDEEVQAPAEEAAPVAEEPAVEPVAEVEAEVEEPTEEASEVEQKALDRITKLEDDLADAKTEIKSLTKKLNEPILKDNVETLDKEQIVAKGTYNPLDAV
jgi:HK97 family phage prohead protease